MHRECLHGTTIDNCRRCTTFYTRQPRANWRLLAAAWVICTIFYGVGVGLR